MTQFISAVDFLNYGSSSALAVLTEKILSVFQGAENDSIDV